ncbi:MAG TPA: hemin ABC transporter substrate-binding protein, partial [Spirochaetia bacterium]|nr:hemin ABC transporter substrate-binding protein [Spirochaetia bacterium]
MTTSRRGRHVALLVSIFGVLVSTVTHAASVTLTDARGVRVRVADTSRIVTLGSAVTETVAALGAADRLVGVDASSSYPAEALAELPRTG